MWRNTTRLYVALLHLYPADFQQAYGEAMTCIFEESLSDALAKSGPAGALRLWRHTLADLATAALAEWRSRFMAVLGIEQHTSLAASIAVTIVLFTLVLMGLSGGGFHPRPSAPPICGGATILHSSTTHASVLAIPTPVRGAR